MSEVSRQRKILHVYLTKDSEHIKLRLDKCKFACTLDVITIITQGDNYCRLWLRKLFLNKIPKYSLI